MSRSPNSCAVGRTALVGMLLVLFTVMAARPAPARAADPLRDATSLAFVPDDAAFYAAMLRNREQYDIVTGSKAFTRLRVTFGPWIGIGTTMLQLQAPEQYSMWLQWSSKPENKQLLQLVGDMVSHEIFVYGDARYPELMELIAEVNATSQTAAIQALRGNHDGDAERKQQRATLKALQARREDLHVPATVIGFKVTMPDAAEAQLARLEQLIGEQLEKDPELAKLKEGLGRVKVGDSEFLRLEIDGSMIPWEETEIETLEDEPGEFDPLIEALKKKKLVIAAGLRGDYLLLLVGESLDALKLNNDTMLLYDRDELAPLRKLAEKRMTGISYVSEEFLRKSNNTKQTLKNMLSAFEAVAAEEESLDEDLKQELKKDIAKLRDAVEDLSLEPGAQLSFNFLTDGGFEGYGYNWGGNSLYNGSQPLTLLRHLGGNPLAFAVGRARYAPENYDRFVQVVKRVAYYAEEIAKKEVSQEEYAEYEKVRDLLLPILRRVNKTTAEKLIPSLKDGQSAFVMDAGMKSRQWFPEMPQSIRPLPMPEPALVYGVSDAALLKEAIAEYYAALQELLVELHKEYPDDVPEITLPSPREEKTDDGTIYYFPNLVQKETAEGSDDLTPNVALSEKVAVMSLSRAHSRRLLKPGALQPETPPLEAREKPLASAAYFNWAGFVDALMPWVEYGIQRGAAQDPSVAIAGESIRTVMRVLQTFRHYSSVSYFEDGAFVTHHASRWQDLQE